MRNASSAPSASPTNMAALDELIEKITVDANGDAEQLWAFRQAFEDGVAVPGEAFVIGEAVSVLKFDYAGNERRGLTASCRRQDGREYVVPAADVVFPPGTEAGRYVAAYRKWMGLTPFPPETAPIATETCRDAASRVIHAKDMVELAVLSVQSATQQTAHCRFLGREWTVTLRTRRSWVPGEIVGVKVRKKWTSGDAHLSAEIKSDRIDAPALDLIPLRLKGRGAWNPIHEYWADEGEPIEGWAKRIIARGPRPAFEMEQVLPGYDYEDPDCDPIGVSNGLKDSGDTRGAYRTLMDLCAADLRCLDAHAHLGNLAFGGMPWEALVAVRHYEVGFRIGEMSLPANFDGVLAWGHIDNRPFLRCMQGYGLCLWILGRFEEASRIFDRMLWLNPTDNQGIRLLIDDVRAKKAWKDRRDK